MRYAIYFTPAAASPLWQQGSRWLDRDAVSGRLLPPLEIAHINLENGERSKLAILASERL